MTNHTEASNVHRPNSPESHYYHVLEQPPYYNFIWLARSAEGRQLLLQDRSREGRQERAKKRKSPITKDIQGEDIADEESVRHNSAQYDYANFREVNGARGSRDPAISELRPQVLDDNSPTQRDQYHWTVLLSPSRKRESEPRSPTKKQKRQIYTRLDCSTMEPKREYTEVRITHEDDQ